MSESIVWSVTEEDIQKTSIVKAPSWLPTEVSDFEIVDAKDGESKNIKVSVRVFAGEYKGMENPFIYFSEKKKELAIPFLTSIGFSRNPDGSFNQKLSKENVVGKKCKAHWTRGEYNNKPLNQIDDWAKLED